MLLKHAGYEADYPSQQTCCGQMHYNAGRVEQAAKLAQRFCHVFEPYDVVVCPSGSCTSMVRFHYPDMVSSSSVPQRVFELCEFLWERAFDVDFSPRLHGRAAVHVGCHSRRMIDNTRAVNHWLSTVRGLTIVPTESDSWCCGFGGTFSVKYPRISTAIGNRKIDNLAASHVDYLIFTDSSCAMHLQGLISRRGWDGPVGLHMAEVLASSLLESRGMQAHG